MFYRIAIGNLTENRISRKKEPGTCRVALVNCCGGLDWDFELIRADAEGEFLDNLRGPVSSVAVV